jgi:guanylate kinase
MKTEPGTQLMIPPLLKRRGILCVVSGPSGSGKTTLCRRYTDTDAEAVYAISATTRAPRGGERDGVDYFFLSREDFQKRSLRGEFLEWAEVHGNFYGTLKSEVLAHLEAGRDVLMDIDVQGAALVRQQADPVIAGAMVDIFILLSSDEELVKRLQGRGTETAEQLALRLHNAREEMRHWPDYTYTVVSRDRETDFATFSAILTGERCRSVRWSGSATATPDQAEFDL